MIKTFNNTNSFSHQSKWLTSFKLIMVTLFMSMGAAAWLWPYLMRKTILIDVNALPEPSQDGLSKIDKSDYTTDATWPCLLWGESRLPLEMTLGSIDKTSESSWPGITIGQQMATFLNNYDPRLFTVDTANDQISMHINKLVAFNPLTLSLDQSKQILDIIKKGWEKQCISN